MPSDVQSVHDCANQRAYPSGSSLADARLEGQNFFWIADAPSRNQVSPASAGCLYRLSSLGMLADLLTACAGKIEALGCTELGAKLLDPVFAWLHGLCPKHLAELGLL